MNKEAENQVQEKKPLLEGNRKMVVVLGLTLVTMVISTTFVMLDKMPSTQWADLAKWLVSGGAGAFVVGNVGEHFAKRTVPAR